jgi:hypothetical protein
MKAGTKNNKSSVEIDPTLAGLHVVIFKGVVDAAS